MCSSIDNTIDMDLHTNIADLGQGRFISKNVLYIMVD